MKVTARPNERDGQTRAIHDSELSDLDQVNWRDDGGLSLRFVAVGIDNDKATYRYTVRLSADELERIVAARYVKPLVERLEEAGVPDQEITDLMKANRSSSKA